MKAFEILDARKREFKAYMGDKTTNTREKQENRYYVQHFDETCSICEHAEDDWSHVIGETYICPHCDVVAWNGWCKKFVVAKRLVKEDEGVTL